MFGGSQVQKPYHASMNGFMTLFTRTRGKGMKRRCWEKVISLVLAGAMIVNAPCNYVSAEDLFFSSEGEIQEYETGEEVESAEEMEHGEEVESAEEMEHGEEAESTEEVKSGEESGYTEEVEGTEEEEFTKDSEGTEDAEFVKDSESMEEEKTAEETKNADGTEPTEETESTEKVNPAKETESKEGVKSAEQVEPTQTPDEDFLSTEDIVDNLISEETEDENSFFAEMDSNNEERH